MSYDVMLDFDLYCLTLTCLNMFMTSQPANHVIGGFRSDLPLKRKREVFILVSMDYYKNLKVEDFVIKRIGWVEYFEDFKPAILTNSVSNTVCSTLV